MIFIFNPVLVLLNKVTAPHIFHAITIQSRGHVTKSLVTGKQASHKCAKVSNEDILQLYCGYEQGMSIKNTCSTMALITTNHPHLPGNDKTTSQAQYKKRDTKKTINFSLSLMGHACHPSTGEASRALPQMPGQAWAAE